MCRVEREKERRRAELAAGTVEARYQGREPKVWGASTAHNARVTAFRVFSWAKDEGVLTFEFPHLLNLIEKVQFDTIYHEHFSYLSLLAVEQVLNSKLQVLPITPTVLAAGLVTCQQVGLLTNDGIVVAVMRANGLTNIASNDTDFDRVPGLTRYAPA